MRASVGDRLLIRGNTVGVNNKIAEIIEVRGRDGSPPYVVRYPDGRTSIVYPGPDSVVEPAAQPA